MIQMSPNDVLNNSSNLRNLNYQNQ